MTFHVSDESNQFSVPMGGGGGSCASGEACQYWIAVTPYCPGHGCMNSVNFTMTASTPNGIELIDSRCFQNGKACVLPTENIVNHHSKRYETFVSVRSPAEFTLGVEACTSSVMIYGCVRDAESKSNCQPLAEPSSSNSDFTLDTTGYVRARYYLHCFPT